MRAYGLDGKIRAQLSEAILAGFSTESLDELLRYNNRLQQNIALGPDFVTRVNSLIDIAEREGWLIELCDALAAERKGNKAVNSAITAIHKILTDLPKAAVVDAGVHEGCSSPSALLKANCLTPTHNKIILLTGVIAMVVSVVIYLAIPTKDAPVPQSHALPTTKIEAHSGGVAIGRDVKGSTINIAPHSGGAVSK